MNLERFKEQLSLADAYLHEEYRKLQPRSKNFLHISYAGSTHRSISIMGIDPDGNHISVLYFGWRGLEISTEKSAIARYMAKKLIAFLIRNKIVRWNKRRKTLSIPAIDKTVHLPKGLGL